MTAPPRPGRPGPASSSCAGGLERPRDEGHAPALEARHLQVVGGGRRRLVVRHGGRAVGRAGLEHRRVRVAERHDDQAEVRERVVERDQRGLVAAVRRGGGAEHRPRLAVQLALEPQPAEAVDVGLQLRRHGAEARRPAEHDGVRPLGVGLGRRFVLGVHGLGRLAPALRLGHHLGGTSSRARRRRTSAPTRGRPRRRRGQRLGDAGAGIEGDQHLRLFGGGLGHGFGPSKTAKRRGAPGGCHPSGRSQARPEPPSSAPHCCWRGTRGRMDGELDDLRAFVAVVETGASAAPPRAWASPKSIVSRRVARLEASLGGARLPGPHHARRFPTEAGAAFHARCRPRAGGAGRGAGRGGGPRGRRGRAPCGSPRRSPSASRTSRRRWRASPPRTRACRWTWPTASGRWTSSPSASTRRQDRRAGGLQPGRAPPRARADLAVASPAYLSAAARRHAGGPRGARLPVYSAAGTGRDLALPRQRRPPRHGAPARPLPRRQRRGADGGGAGGLGVTVLPTFLAARRCGAARSCRCCRPSRCRSTACTWCARRAARPRRGCAR
jgi:hypothetical protein